jgi:hypothetical protein
LEDRYVAQAEILRTDFGCCGGRRIDCRRAISAADPIWPVAGDESASATIADLEAEGYNVAINWVNGYNTVPLSQCTVNAIHNPDRSADSQKTFTTFYVDIECPDSNHPGFGFGFGFG